MNFFLDALGMVKEEDAKRSGTMGAKRKLVKDRDGGK